MLCSSVQIPSHIVSRTVISKFRLTKKFAQLSPNYILRNNSHRYRQISSHLRAVVVIFKNTSYLVGHRVISKFHLQ